MIKIAHLYYDLLNLYGDDGNLKAITYCLDKLNIEYSLDKITINDEFDLLAYDFIYVGSGTEKNLYLAINDIKKYESQIRQYIDDNKIFLATGNALDMFGKFIDSFSGEKIDTLDIFNFCSKEKNKRNVGEVMFAMGSIKPLIGFLNNTFSIEEETVKNYSNLFEIYKSIGYTITKNAEGVTKNNFYGTHIIGPILVRNPEILRYFVSRLIQEKNIELEDSITKIDTEFELKARDEFINNYYKNQKPKKLC